MFNNTSENILWYILNFNKIEQVSINLCFDVYDKSVSLPRYVLDGEIISIFKIVPNFMEPIFYEKVYAPYGNRGRCGSSLRKNCSPDRPKQYSFLDLVYNVAKDVVIAKDEIENYQDNMGGWPKDGGDYEKDFIVTFFSKNQRIIIDEVGI